MSVYFVAILQEVVDAESQAEYGRRAFPHLATTQAIPLASALVKTGEAGRIYELNPALEELGVKPLETIEGDAADGIGLFKFPNKKAFEEWYRSEEYQQVLPYRSKGSRCQAFLVEGVD
ncbi:DUF1330 domain-containing protein [Gordonia rubripertincta]|uniref:DUF1330 domain-containing protein n=1 Tax=Gordonia rubripertincta TaxID=36822 RepID=A0ABT4MZA5_GORRU|nr:DUF1330 domain-containing protein [Gordonia rubripertincta]MCZ4551047.1 DUF1330 domain-containing protein [Gordonia rubripertincta]